MAFYNAFDWYPFGERLKGNVVQHCGCFQGKEFKLLAQSFPYCMEYAGFEINTTKIARLLCEFLKVASRSQVSRSDLRLLNSEAPKLIYEQEFLSDQDLSLVI